jgi:hypothetical protein
VTWISAGNVPSMKAPVVPPAEDGLAAHAEVDERGQRPHQHVRLESLLVLYR